MFKLRRSLQFLTYSLIVPAFCYHPKRNWVLQTLPRTMEAYTKGDGCGGLGFYIDRDPIQEVDENSDSDTMPPSPTTLIWLHGLGDTGESFLDFPKQWKLLGYSFPKHMKFIFPTAKTQPITLNMGIPCTAWADVADLKSADGDMKGLKISMERIFHLIDREITQGVRASRVFVGGFSQGGALAYYVLRHYPEKLGGIIALSAWVPECSGEILALAESTKKNFFPILHLHGESDEMVKCELAEKSLEALKSNSSVNLQFQKFPGIGHTISPEELKVVGDFFEKLCI